MGPEILLPSDAFRTQTILGVASVLCIISILHFRNAAYRVFQQPVLKTPIQTVFSNDTICYLMHNTSRGRVAPALICQYLNNFIKEAGLPPSISLLCSPQHCLHPKDPSLVHDKDAALSMSSSDMPTCKGKYFSSTVCFLRTKKLWQGSAAESPYSIGQICIMCPSVTDTVDTMP